MGRSVGRSIERSVGRSVDRSVGKKRGENSEVVREILPGLIRPGSNTSYNFHFGYRGKTARPLRLMQTTPPNPKRRALSVSCKRHPPNPNPEDKVPAHKILEKQTQASLVRTPPVRVAGRSACLHRPTQSERHASHACTPCYSNLFNII